MRSKTKLTSFFTLAAGWLISAPLWADNHVPVTLVYQDAAGVGVNDVRSLTLPDGTVTTVGDFRKSTLEYVARAVALQFNNSAPIEWGVRFESKSGYDAITFGPNFMQVRASEPDPYGVIDVGDWVPVTLFAALRNNAIAKSDGTLGDTYFHDGDNLMQAIMPQSNQAQLVSVAYHELIHMYGFAHSECLGNCITGRHSNNSHITPFYWYRDNTDALLPYESLDLDGREKAGQSVNRYLAGGNNKAPHTSQFARHELTAGTWSDAGGNYVELYAEPDSNNNWDGQAGSHLSFAVQPAQLMASSAAFTQDLGVAAAILCDAGWCRGQGQVIDISARAVLDSNASSATQTYIDVIFENTQSTDVAQAAAHIRLDPAYTNVSVTGDTAGCTVTTDVVDCRFSLAAQDTKKLTLTLGALSEAGYVIAGELYSEGYDVDRNGFNNILDATLGKKAADTGGNSGGGNTGNGSGPVTPPVTPPVTEAGSSGGASSVWLLGLLSLLGWRRMKAVAGKERPRRQRISYAALPLALAILLSGCGGGSGSSTSVTPPLSITLAASSSLSENSVIEVPLSVSGAQGGVTASVTHNGPAQLVVTPQLTSTGGVLRLQLDDIYQHQEARLTLTVTDGAGRSQTAVMNVTLQNSAGFHGVISDLPASGISLTEHSSVSLTLIFDGAEGEVSIDAVPTSKEADIHISSTLTSGGAILTVVTGELVYHDQPLTLDLTFTDEAGTVFGSLQTFALENTSGAQVASAFNKLVSATPAFVAFNIERELVKRLSMLAVLMNPAYNEAESALLQQFDRAPGSKAAIDDWLIVHQDDVTRYQQGELTEQALLQTQQALTTLLQQHAAPVDAVISQAVLANGGTVPDIALQAPLLDSESAQLSRFIGNSALGQYQEGRWQFSSQFAFLDPIVYPQNQSCAAE
ncbi:hypothetical protein [Rheinheimera aquimaris]|uniref:hypothetical protein n=1 Tax=Rheinheimera aquimaris TaxID=412437 RepID=UPI0010659A4A|nr:hypothetical protein [Rheinheimera aquimaris]